MKTLTIDAIVGVGFPTLQLAMQCEQAGLASYTGNQHNPAWEWDRTQLEGVEEVLLQELYQGLREAREAPTPEPTAVPFFTGQHSILGA